MKTWQEEDPTIEDPENTAMHLLDPAKWNFEKELKVAQYGKDDIWSCAERKKEHTLKITVTNEIIISMFLGVEFCITPDKITEIVALFDFTTTDGEALSPDNDFKYMRVDKYLTEDEIMEIAKNWITEFRENIISSMMGSSF